MRYVSLFSGIEAASVAWHPLGWTPVAFAEIEPFPSAVLAHHYPHVPNLGDVTKANWDAIGSVDLVVFGSPCQSFSVAGKRLGLDDPRGNLALFALKVVERVRPRWFLFENVPGLLSSGDGRDFGQFLAAVGECGYQCAWRVLDAQYFGVPQRRRRVFVVGCAGNWRGAAAVLFERHSLQGHSPPSRAKGEGIAPTIASRPSGGGGLGTDFDCVGLISMCINAHPNRLDAESETLVTHALRGEGFDASEDGTGRGTPLIAFAHQQGGSMDLHMATDTALALQRNQGQAIAFSSKDHGADAGGLAPTLRAMGHRGSHANAGGQLAVATFDERNVTSKANRTKVEFGNPSNTLHESGLSIIGPSVRRLTPRECERLQGFPDDYTLIPYRGKDAADGPRYKALGNSMAVPVMSWLGRRIQTVENLRLERMNAA